jgi:Fe-S cluster assembly protein SufD
MTLAVDMVSGFEDSLSRVPAHGRAWVNTLRQRGADAFRRQGIPTDRLEEWRDTSVAELARLEFMPADRRDGRADGKGAAGHSLVEQFSFGRESAAELVFINGHFEPSLSKLKGLPTGVRAMSLQEAMEGDAAGVVEAHLGKYANVAEHPFAALNTGMVAEGVFVHLARGAVCRRPIHMLFITVASDVAAVSHPRVLVVADENSESSLVETYAGGGGGTYWTNAVTEIVQAPSARIDHNKLQQEGNGAYHTALMQVHLERESVFVSHSTSIGSKLTRNDLQVFMGGERAEATLNGLVYARGDQHIDNHTLLRHEKAHCPSHELYKHVLADRATAVFKGKIFVQKDAQKTDSKQTSKALLLSDTAFMNSQPALEIYADDVKCTHGSTTGPVDPNAVFYLVSRGLSLEQATHLMTYAFAADITRRIKVTPVRARIEDFMSAQHGLPQDLRITEEAAHDVALH